MTGRAPSPEPIGIVIGDPGSEVQRRLHEGPSVKWVLASEAAEEDLISAEFLLVWDFREGSFERWIGRCPGVKWIQAASAGVNHLLTPAVVDSDITLTNARGVFERPIAEYVLGLLLMHAKGFIGTWNAKQSHQWLYRETMPLWGSNALVIGLGAIGSAIALALTQLDVRVRGVRRSGTPHELAEVVYAPTQVDEGLGWADWVILAAPLTDETRKIINRPRLARLKPNAYVVNIGRGELIDEAALFEALREERIGGAALDVFVEEPLSADHPAWGVPRLFVSPHMSADVVGWRGRILDLLDLNVERYHSGEPLLNVVEKDKGY